MDKNIWLAILATAIIVGVLSSIITVQLTGNAVVPTTKESVDVYTKAEVDKMLKEINTSSIVINKLKSTSSTEIFPYRFSIRASNSSGAYSLDMTQNTISILKGQSIGRNFDYYTVSIGDGRLIISNSTKNSIVSCTVGNKAKNEPPLKCDYI